MHCRQPASQPTLQWPKGAHLQHKPRRPEAAPGPLRTGPSPCWHQRGRPWAPQQRRQPPGAERAGVGGPAGGPPALHALGAAVRHGRLLGAGLTPSPPPPCCFRSPLPLRPSCSPKPCLVTSCLCASEPFCYPACHSELELKPQHQLGMSRLCPTQDHSAHQHTHKL